MARIARDGWWIMALLFAVVLNGCAAGQKQVQREGDSQAHYKIGISYLNEGQIQPAYVEFQKAVELNPRDKNVHYALGFVFDRMERYSDAAMSYRRSLEIDPDFPEAHNGLGVVYAELLQWKEAVAEYRAALSNSRYLTPQRAYFNLGKVYFNQDQFIDALSAFQEAAKIQPDEGLFHFWAGKSHERLGKPKEAIAAFQEAARRIPDSGEIHYSLGTVLLREGFKQDAVREFKKVVELSPNTEMAENSIRYIEGVQP
ncbi:MAG: tetratricopeptide repeat protein [Nitrospirae bacterium]|nr:tetratricopeptide repeat protein [Nitrospirota bacterium]